VTMNPEVGAASTHVRSLIGPPRAGVVRHVGRRRLGLEVSGRLVVLDGGAGPGTLPCSVIVPGLRPGSLAAPGDAVVLDGAALRLGRGEVRVVRWWEPSRVRLGAALERGAAPRCALAEPSLPRGVHPVLREAAHALLAGDEAAAAGALISVLGRGPGSTPDADDAVAGLLLAARAHLPVTSGADVEAVSRSVALAAPARTTLLSAELLHAAVVGAAAPAVVRHVVAPDDDTAAAVRALGASSGAATLAGIDLLVAAVTERAASPGGVAA
jgi:hypothetical protein